VRQYNRPSGVRGVGELERGCIRAGDLPRSSSFTKCYERILWPPRRAVDSDCRAFESREAAGRPRGAAMRQMSVWPGEARADV